MSAINRADCTLSDDLREHLEKTLAMMAESGHVARVWSRDPYLWRSEPEHVEEIPKRLGWLTLPADCLQHVEELEQFAAAVRDAGFERVVLLGMGGSSLAPWAFEAMFGVTEGFPALGVLDSTSPEEVLAATADTPLEKCLFIVASKSGTTVEPNTFFEHFFARVAAVKGDAAGENFVAITDPGSQLAELAAQRKLRRVFENWPDHGGRYSAMSYFGMVPAALMGLPVRRMLAEALAMAEVCGPDVPPNENPGALLGALLGCCHSIGRDKLTLLAAPPFAAFGDWVEQLIAESTGKEGIGVVPVVGEQIGEAAVYGDDRIFVTLQPAGDTSLQAIAEELAEAGHPVVEIEIPEVTAIGQEVFRWEFATAIAGALMGIDPFDQPDVQAAKTLARNMLDAYAEGGAIPTPPRIAADGALSAYGSICAETVSEALAALLGKVNRGDYVALMAYLPRTDRADDALQEIRTAIRDELSVATTVGYGPRFLHSTGQLHKGGANTGVFIQFVADDAASAEIPGAEYDFGVLKDAQAGGDFEALVAGDRRALRIHLGADAETGLEAVAEMVSEALAERER